MASRSSAALNVLLRMKGKGGFECQAMNKSSESLLHRPREFTKPSLALVIDLIVELHDSAFLHEQSFNT